MAPRKAQKSKIVLLLYGGSDENSFVVLQQRPFLSS